MKATLYQKVMLESGELPEETGYYETDNGRLIFDNSTMPGLFYYNHESDKEAELTWWLKEVEIDIPEGKKLEKQLDSIEFEFTPDSDLEYIVVGAKYILDKLKEQIK